MYSYCLVVIVIGMVIVMYQFVELQKSDTALVKYLVQAPIQIIDTWEVQISNTWCM